MQQTHKAERLMFQTSVVFLSAAIVSILGLVVILSQ